MGGGYSSLQAAFDAVSDGGTIEMQSDVTLEKTAKLTGKKKATLKLNGRTINFPGTATDTYRAIYVGEGADLTIDGEGTISAGQVAIECSNAKATINSGTYNGQFSIFAGSDATVNVENGNFNGYVYTNGLYKNSNLTINNGTFTKSLYLAAGKGSKYVINGGTFTEKEESTIEIKGGSLSINGGTFTNKSTNQSLEYNSNGSSSSGYALAVLAHKNYQGANVTVNGGNFDGYVGLNDVPEGVDVNSSLTIYGGEFTNDITKYTSIVAKIGNEEYISLQGAFDAVKDDETIDMQKDITITKTATLTDKKKATLNLNGKTISITGDGSCAIKVTGGADLTIDGQDGTINAGQVAVRCGNEPSSASKDISYLTINNGTYNNVILASGYADVTINNGTFSSNNENDIYSVHTNGTSKYENAYRNNKIVINNGTFKNMLYLAGINSNYEINGGTFTDENGKSAVEIKGGTMTINGGTFIGKAPVGLEPDGNGPSTYGYALAAVEQAAYEGGKVIVNGGTFNGTVEKIKVVKDEKEPTTYADLAIKGGSYVNDISTYVALGLKQIQIGEKYGVAEEKTAAVTVANEETTKKVKEELGEKATEGTTEKVDTFSLSDLTQAYLVRATYPVSDESGKKADVDVDFDLGATSEIGGTASFGVVFYNIPAGLTIGTPTISVAK